MKKTEDQHSFIEPQPQQDPPPDPEPQLEPPPDLEPQLEPTPHQEPQQDPPAEAEHQPEPPSVSPSSLHVIGAAAEGDARGFGWNLSPSIPDEEEHPNQIPTLEDLQASHSRILATQRTVAAAQRTLAAAQRTLATAVKQHGVQLAKYVASQQQGGR
ncbi:uncharacterized protein ACNLHF_014316 [Anomaloglossus baeobatrachus]